MLRRVCLLPSSNAIRRVVLLFLQAMPTYLMMIVLPSHIAQYAVLLFTMTFLSWIHIQRLSSTDARQQSVDITA